jgi:uncharacterized surface protein with fasciclin (FAS1) repeats
MQLVLQDKRLSAFATALDLCNLAGLLDGETDTTAFAPTNVAFARLDDLRLQEWFRDPQVLRQVLLHHLVCGRLEVRDLIRIGTLETLGGGKLRIQASTDGVSLGAARIENCDITARNGVLHLISNVLEPPSPLAPSSPEIRA